MPTRKRPVDHATRPDEPSQPAITPSLAAAALGRLGGQARSEAKTAACRRNGKLGGYRRHKARRVE